MFRHPLSPRKLQISTKTKFENVGVIPQGAVGVEFRFRFTYHQVRIVCARVAFGAILKEDFRSFNPRYSLKDVFVL